ncbi:MULTISPECIES: hypothetical protein [unclassified Streptomyces]|uniref:hypothetical protein n=1 Tax=unclassified Streptomyces TaxID=2593676 RepID=UPI002E355F9A|nr:MULTISPECIES: hypothetical protein [unclassified Streptomyces]
MGDHESAAKPAQQALVLLQAAVAEAAAGEFDLAKERVPRICALAAQELLPLAKVVAAYLDRFTLVNGHEWASAQAPGEEPRSLDDRVPPARALTLRLMSAWSSEDRAMFTDLFTTAAQDRPAGADHLQDLFIYALEWTEFTALRSVNPRVMVKGICKAIDTHGPSSIDWTTRS